MAVGPQHAIVGDGNYGTDQPQTRVPAEDISRQVNMAKFSKTQEFKVLKDVISQRIEYFKKYQPGGNGVDFPLRDLSNEERGWRSLAADLLIHELQSIIGAYESANEVVRNAKKRSAGE